MRFSRFLIALAVGVNVASVVYAGQEQVYKPGQAVTAPVVEKDLKPHYTPAALTARVQGFVKLECVVRADGTVGDIRVVEPLHPDLDAASVRALTEWRFKPGMKDGKPVAVRVEIDMSFRLSDAAHQPKGPPLDSPEVFKPSAEVKAPRIRVEVKPTYSPTALRDKAQGMVRLDCVVLPDGSVGDIRVSQRLHPDLDDEAVRTLRKWRFLPGTKDGVAVPVQVEVEMTFTLGSGPRKSGDER